MRMFAAACLSVTVVFALVFASSGAAKTPRKFRNCAALNTVYPHGVGRVGARDHTSGTPPVTTFKRNTALYQVNKGRDGDKDGVACEQA
jgi:hypothetical protein